jgi:hypothetical protein
MPLQGTAPGSGTQRNADQQRLTHELGSALEVAATPGVGVGEALMSIGAAPVERTNSTAPTRCALLSARA